MSKQKPKMRERQEVINRGGKYPLLLILVMIILIAIPSGIVVNLLYQGYIRTGTPIFGDRFEGDLNPSITNQQMKRITDSLKTMNGIENAESHLQTGTYKIYINVDDNIASEAYEPLAQQAITAVYEVLPEATYFTSTETRRQYDLEISLYNSTDLSEEEPLIYMLAYKNGMMETSNFQMLSNAVNPELAEKLRADEIARQLAQENPNSQVGQEGVESPSTETDVEPETNETP